MVELGKYGAEVVSAYGVTLALLAAIVWFSVSRSRRMRRALEEAEGRAKRG